MASEPLVQIGSGRLRAGVARLGAALWDLRLDGGPSLVLGFADADAYRASRTHAGAILGRVSNRLGGGVARIGGRPLALARNVPPYHLHGGATGFSMRRWRVVDHAPDRLRLRLVSPDGHEGYPGRLVAEATYETTGTALAVRLEARSDAATLANLTCHAYFDLTGRGSASHRLQADAERHLAVDRDLVPTGEVAAVAGTPLDFRAGRAFDPARHPVNHTLVLADAPVRPLARAARVEADGAPLGVAALEVWTTQPALHVYDGARIPAGTRRRDGRAIGPGDAFSLEAQGWTDAPNHAGFPSIELGPGQVYSQVIEYRLEPAA